MACIYNPVCATETIKNPRLHCNIIWEYCQFQVDEYVSTCPILHAYSKWYKYWIISQHDQTRKVTLLVNGVQKTCTVNELKALLIDDSNELTRFVFNAFDTEIVEDEKLLKLAIQKGYVTIYNSQQQLISLGRNAFANNTKLKTLDASTILYIGPQAFYNCTNLKTISFANKTDLFIPDLDDINAFYDIHSNILDVSIIVPANLYEAWIKAPNWILLKDHITKA